MSLSRQGQRKLKEWINLLTEQRWSAEDKKYLVDYWLAHHDEEGGVIAKGHPLYQHPPQDSEEKK